jgi:hypothetical protein
MPKESARANGDADRSASAAAVMLSDMIQMKCPETTMTTVYE